MRALRTSGGAGRAEQHGYEAKRKTATQKHTQQHDNMQVTTTGGGVSSVLVRDPPPPSLPAYS